MGEEGPDLYWLKQITLFIQLQTFGQTVACSTLKFHANWDYRVRDIIGKFQKISPCWLLPDIFNKVL